MYSMLDIINYYLFFNLRIFLIFLFIFVFEIEFLKQVIELETISDFV